MHCAHAADDNVELLFKIASPHCVSCIPVLFLNTTAYVESPIAFSQKRYKISKKGTFEPLKG